MALEASYRQQEGLIKEAGIFGAAQEVAKGFSMPSSALRIGAGIALSGLVMKKLVDKLNNDINRKALIENLAISDPVLKNVDKKQLLEWYATIYHCAPKLSLDKATVREVLTTFARFGKVDVQTLKTLAESEENIAKADSVRSWTNVFK